MENTDLELFQKTVIYDQNNDIFVQPLCDLFEINYKNQKRFIKNDHILGLHGAKKYQVGASGKRRAMTSLTKEGFLRWIMILNPIIIKAELREQFKSYQSLITDYLFGKSLVPLMQETYAINSRIMQINRNINAELKEINKLKMELRRIEDKKHGQLGLELIFNNNGNAELQSGFKPLIIENQ